MNRIKKFINVLNELRGLTNIILVVLVIVLFCYVLIFVLNPTVEAATIVNLFFTPLVTVTGFVLVYINLRGIQDSNKALLSEPAFKKHEKEINDLEAKSHQKVITDNTVSIYQFIISKNCSGVNNPD